MDAAHDERHSHHEDHEGHEGFGLFLIINFVRQTFILPRAKTPGSQSIIRFSLVPFAPLREKYFFVPFVPSW
jgi:hypothetical protein